MTTWTFSRKSWVVRFYLWFYKANPHDVTFCKLFWGLLFAPILLPFRIIGKPLVPIFDRIVERIDNRFMNKEYKPHPRLTKFNGALTKFNRVAIIVFLPIAAYECYRWPWDTFFWTPYFLFFGWQNFGIKKTRFGRFLIDGYHSIKDRSCPTIDIDQ